MNQTEVDEETHGHGGDETSEKGLELAHTESVEQKERESVGSGDEHTGPERQTKQNLKRDSRSDDFLDV